MAWQATRQSALAQLDSFAPKAGRAYAASRNFDRGAGEHTGVSGLSPWIRHRLITEEEVLAAILSQHSFEAAEKFIAEVFWRGYFNGWLEHQPEVWLRYRRGVRDGARQLETDASLARRYEEATSGQTGIDCFDHWARELIETGYLHNHARMWFASIWIFTLQVPWELGADFFYRHLLDGDAASNTCSWRWVGGLHTKGKTYLARADNIKKFTDGRFNPSGLATTAPPLSEPDLPARIAPHWGDAPTLPARYGLLLHEEDCSPASLPLSHAPCASMALTAPAPRSVFDSAPLVKDFTSACVEQAAHLAQQHWSLECAISSEADPAQVLSNWARENAMEAIVTARLPLGPTRKRVMEACAALDLPLIEITRAYDAAVWPHARAGFFGLKKKIPAILAQLELV